MKKNIFYISAIMLNTLLLSSCHQTLSYDDLMQHPTMLQKEYEYCQGKNTKECDIVVQAAEDFRALVQQRSNDPEAFGLQIMKAQQSGDEKKVKLLHAVVRATSVE